MTPSYRHQLLSVGECRIVAVMANTHNRIEMIGRRFGSWLVISHNTGAYWNCVCDCGRERAVHGSTMRTGKSTSCGCANMIGNTHRLTHAQSRTRLYKTWIGMKSRCINSADKGYARYGGRGITIAPEWAEFTAFHAWATSSGYDETLTIERRDVNAGYFPDNCEWITKSAQGVNRSNTIRLKDGRPVALLRRVSGVSSKLYQRRVKAGWDQEAAASTPP